MTTANDDAKLTETMAALNDGGEPTCPYCGAPFTGDHRTKHLAYEWKCGTWKFAHSRYLHREQSCYERELAALRGLLWQAGHAFQDHHAINWEPICRIMEEEDERNAKEDANG